MVIQPQQYNTQQNRCKYRKSSFILCHMVNSPQKGQWRGVLMFSLICVWTIVRLVISIRHCAHYGVIVMIIDHFRSSFLKRTHIRSKTYIYLTKPTLKLGMLGIYIAMFTRMTIFIHGTILMLIWAPLVKEAPDVLGIKYLVLDLQALHVYYHD